VFPSSAEVQKVQRTSLLVLSAAALIALLYFGRAFCITLVIAVIIAFILDPFVGLVMRLRFPRGLASFVVCTLALVLVYLVGLGLYAELSGLSDELPVYSQRANTIVDNIADRIDQMEQNAYKLLVPKRMQEKDKDKAQAQAQQIETKKKRRQQPVIPPPPDAAATPQVQEVRIIQERPSLVRYVYSYVTSFYNVLLMISFVPFLVYFMLSWRDHFRKSFLTLFEGPDRSVAGKSWNSIADMARAYVFGNFLLGLLVSLASCISFWSWHLPYWLLVGFMSGFLSLVPYVGLPLAMIPPVFAALAVYATLSPFLLIIGTVAFFHLLALNLLYPQIVGARVHLNPLAVTIALMFWGTIWGGIGLVLAIPITAAAKAVFDNIDTLQPYGKMLGD
jgi:predicted PurR-regulated permease PerM